MKGEKINRAFSYESPTFVSSHALTIALQAPLISSTEMS